MFSIVDQSCMVSSVGCWAVCKSRHGACCCSPALPLMSSESGAKGPKAFTFLGALLNTSSAGICRWH